MKVLRTARMRIITAAALAAASSFLTVSSVSADPSDPICWLADASVYCGAFENINVGDPGYAECERRFHATQNSPYCEE